MENKNKTIEPSEKLSQVELLLKELIKDAANADNFKLMGTALYLLSETQRVTNNKY